jgi:hypothetical protein
MLLEFESGDLKLTWGRATSTGTAVKAALEKFQ